MMERKETLAEILTEENENLYEANKYALYTDYNTSREMMYKVCAFNRKLIETIETLENKVNELEKELHPEIKSYTILSNSVDEGNWFFMTIMNGGVEYKIEAKIFEEPHEKYGLPQSGNRISKFFVKDMTNNKTIVMSDRGYISGEENLKDPLILAFVEEILKYADSKFQKNINE
jgi:hypothetical protein